MTRFFISGGDGFIGFHICKELLKDKKNKIVIYDAHKHYIPLEKSHWFKYQNYRINELGKKITRIRGDTTDRDLLKESLQKHKPDVIIHLAALPIANISNDYPEEARLNIFKSITILMDVVRELQLKCRVIYTSSSMVYGNFLRDKKGNIIPAIEDQQCNPICLYGAMKLSGEHIVKVYSKRFNIPYTIIRPSAVYGPTDCNRRVTEIFVRNALQSKELILDNGGLHQLDFTYVEDVAKGFVLAANSSKAINQTFNLTAGKGRSIKELANIISRIVPSKIVEKETDVYRPNRGTLDISKAKKLLGYSPQFSLEKGMKKYIGFLQEELKWQ